LFAACDVWSLGLRAWGCGIVRDGLTGGKGERVKKGGDAVLHTNSSAKTETKMVKKSRSCKLFLDLRQIRSLACPGALAIRARSSRHCT
jgi:hypothetical protein